MLFPCRTSAISLWTCAFLARLQLRVCLQQLCPGRQRAFAILFSLPANHAEVKQRVRILRIIGGCLRKLPQGAVHVTRVVKARSELCTDRNILWLHL